MATQGETKISSLEDRITHPHQQESTSSTAKEETKKPTSSEGMNAAAPSFTPGQPSSWADDVSSPVDTVAPAAEKSDAKDAGGDVGKAQTDGASEFNNGSAGIYEPSYDVDVKLNDIQADPNNPLYSVKSFEELNL